MKQLLLLWLCLSTALAADVRSDSNTVDRKLIIDRLAQELAPRLARSRYMEANPQKVTVPGWENFPTIKYTYTLNDKATGTNKTVSVIMLNPDAQLLARWIVTACFEVKGSADTNLTKKLTDRIISQSGGQFPVRGIVYEDILPANGIHEVYCFMDGVTVKVNGVDHRSEKQSSPDQMNKALQATKADVTWVGKYARIQGTTREEYQQAGGKENVQDAAWLDISRKLYQQAWNSDRNELLIAWARVNL
ncbi:hypothetical protein [Pedosphaera parvula]|uniref:Secreted protein n=1 Tax=Pedosphaera parvula (strain Ellin514) TaxID=320771 RepID=B9XBJ4_PEDPL|nr:hypothetical protein [Pedosphaera parvula]EEF62879.1 hypothetical protein Cflav_PD5514 [Pedosphaera parvula Ellin514]